MKKFLSFHDPTALTSDMISDQPVHKMTSAATTTGRLGTAAGNTE